MAERVRVATFNLENFDDVPGDKPGLEERVSLMRPQLLRVNADVLCLQEVHSQGKVGERDFSALDALLDGTPYAGFQRAATETGSGEPYDERNLLVLSRFDITESHQYINEFADAPSYRMITADGEPEAKEIRWERPILHVGLATPVGRIDVVNLHLKSKIPTDIEGQKLDSYTWRSASGWAEGYFVSSMKRVGQALEVRMLIDSLFDEDEEALIICCGDFNADLDEVPVQAIRGDVESTGNGALAPRVMAPTENSVAEPSRYSLLHRGRGEMIDHLLVSRRMLRYHLSTEIHNELLHDESFAFATDEKFPESDHAAVIASFEFPEE